MGHSDLSRIPGQLPVAARPGLVVAAPRQDRRRTRRLSISHYLPFIITLLAGGIVVAIVALALSGSARSSSPAIPLPPPSVSATPGPSIGPATGHHGSGH